MVVVAHQNNRNPDSFDNAMQRKLYKITRQIIVAFGITFIPLIIYTILYLSFEEEKIFFDLGSMHSSDVIFTYKPFHTHISSDTYKEYVTRFGWVSKRDADKSIT